ncbi:enolase C-terminal domain-like protein [Streptomyces sp. NPDC058678]|uniref:enolase C-terminal domain-like protein n=1 Tax=Streptomyces sp. NPDC058678 TaxID=3346595 RepID=UPI00364779F8
MFAPLGALLARITRTQTCHVWQALHGQVPPLSRIAVDANQRPGRPARDRLDARPGAVRPVLDREAHLPRRLLGHAAVRKGVSPIKVATGEHIANQVVFKQLLQAGAVDTVQIRSTPRGSAASTRTSPSCCSPRSSGWRSALMRSEPAVRDGPAPVDVRLRRRVRHDRGPRHRVRRPPARALRRPGPHRRRPLPRTDSARAERADAP